MLGVSGEEGGGTGEGVGGDPEVGIINGFAFFGQGHPQVAVGVDNGLVERDEEESGEKTGDFVAGNSLVQGPAREFGLDDPWDGEGVFTGFFDEVLDAGALFAESPYIDENGCVGNQLHAGGSGVRVASTDCWRASKSLSGRSGRNSAAARAEAIVPLAGTMRSTTSEKVQPSFQLLSRW